MGYTRFPLTPALTSPLGRVRMVHRLSITLVPECAQQPSAKHESDASCSLSLRERARVKGKYSVEHTDCRVSQRLLSKSRRAPRWLHLRGDFFNLTKIARWILRADSGKCQGMNRTGQRTIQRRKRRDRRPQGGT